MQAMNTNNDDEMLKSFFSKNKAEISDNGFTNTVIRKLPTDQNKDWIVWIFTLAGLALTMFFSYTTGLITAFFHILISMPQYYLFGSVFCFPIIVFLIMLIQKNERIRFV